ncbi:hypothetical protein C6988_10090 [Nitrosopumilus sp. b1]|uniref:hypothetical protein n=1 Tax=Nitrosopumilus sp. b1 TaxID=2109907 RepID=UPI0015F6863D|nr:hypothetical protein [Nitrosopumilus sp. b1]KAF6242144.1 hypothetical protein C6988_10090 [Nitrosopumilus sp. b1]
MKWKFSESDKEWHQTILNAFENILKMKIKPVLVYDRKHFANYLYKGATKPGGVWAECIKECGTIWLNPHLSTEPKVETVNTIYHECLHIKFPKMHENKVRKLADKMIPVASSLSSKKKIFDIVHSH